MNFITGCDMWYCIAIVLYTRDVLDVTCNRHAVELL